MIFTKKTSDFYPDKDFHDPYLKELSTNCNVPNMSAIEIYLFLLQ